MSDVIPTWNLPGPTWKVFISVLQLHCLVPGAEWATGLYLASCIGREGEGEGGRKGKREGGREEGCEGEGGRKEAVLFGGL